MLAHGQSPGFTFLWIFFEPPYFFFSSGLFLLPPTVLRFRDFPPPLRTERISQELDRFSPRHEVNNVTFFLPSHCQLFGRVASHSFFGYSGTFALPRSLWEKKRVFLHSFPLHLCERPLLALTTHWSRGMQQASEKCAFNSDDCTRICLSAVSLSESGSFFSPSSRRSSRCFDTFVLAFSLFFLPARHVAYELFGRIALRCYATGAVTLVFFPPLNVFTGFSCVLSPLPLLDLLPLLVC